MLCAYSGLFMILTSVSPGCDTIAHKHPAKNPEIKVTPSCDSFEYVCLGSVKTYLYMAFTVFSNVLNLTIVYGTCLHQRGPNPL